jgi:hypothetical protein
MFDRVIAVADGRLTLDGTKFEQPEISSTHLSWFERLLADSPASLQDVSLGHSSDGDVALEWQAVFQGVGVGYLRGSGKLLAVCILLNGQFPSSEQAAIDAVQQTVQAAKMRNSGFEVVRKHASRPLRALVITDSAIQPETLSMMQYWTDCLGTAYFKSLGIAAHVNLRTSTSNEAHEASIM